jgi:hypothetical protein
MNWLNIQFMTMYSLKIWAINCLLLILLFFFNPEDGVIMYFRNIGTSHHFHKAH